MSFDTTSPWGAYPARGLNAFCLGLIERLPSGGLGRRLAFLLRKPVKNSRAPFFDREIWGFKLRLGTRGNLTEQRWLTMAEFHDAAERAALAAALPDGGVFVDVGMNAGFYTFWALSLRRPGLRVLAVEPSPALLERVRFNLATNHLATAVILCPCAVTPEPCELVIETHARNLGQNSVRIAADVPAIISSGSPSAAAPEAPRAVAAPAPERTELRVPGRPLLDLLREAGLERLDALKIDIEGHETPVLAAFFRDAPRALWPLLIIAEIVGDGAGALRALLLKHGYVIEMENKMNGILRLPV